jgi:hypothetical protein
MSQIGKPRFSDNTEIIFPIGILFGIASVPFPRGADRGLLFL